MRRYFLNCWMLAGIALVCAFAAPLAAQSLRIYSIDAEGGQSTLLVAPTGASLLVDAGWPGNGGRDAARIQAAMKDAGIQRIDHLLTTHYHRDHVGGVPELVAHVPVGEFLDHGPNREDSDVTRQDYAAYLKAIEGRPRRMVHPGDTIDLGGVPLLVVAADGDAAAALPGIPSVANPVCLAEEPWPADPTENARSVGFLLTFGRFRFLDLGDLTGQKELALVCPRSALPPVDLFLVSHHGLDKSNAMSLLTAIHPRVAILNNSSHKGASPKAWQIVRNSPGLEDLWQLHTAESPGAHNSPEATIANPAGVPDAGAYLKVVANSNGSFTVMNSRTGAAKTYAQK